ncbi:MAG: trypsin-like peptidase domain-containing protein [Nitrososphaerota archaeon]|jgi:S1-C subfamily serine protease|nr:trypsin-like peptidase domain-containing protein [Nitrososphaerota archaeon]
MAKIPEDQSEANIAQTEENNTTQDATTFQEETPNTQQTPLNTPTINSENKYCKQCSRATTEDNFCIHCGAANAPKEAAALFEPINDDSGVPPPVLKSHVHRQKSRNLKTVMVALLAVCLLAGSFIGYAATYAMFTNQFADLQNQLSSTQESFSKLDNKLNALQTQLQLSQTTNEQNSVDASQVSYELSELYQNVIGSVVEITCLVPTYRFGFQIGYSAQQGSGFVTTANGQQVIVTNNHVINSGSNITVTFADNSSYAATVLGYDAYADLAILKVDNIPKGIPSLTLISSSTLKIGDDVVAVGSPYGLTGTLTTGIISALDRTITANGITIQNMIQTTAEINSGNSGGPLINYKGQVVGITTAVVSGSNGLGFAVSSDTILREIDSLITTGKYTQPPTV